MANETCPRSASICGARSLKWRRSWPPGRPRWRACRRSCRSGVAALGCRLGCVPCHLGLLIQLTVWGMREMMARRQGAARTSPRSPLHPPAGAGSQRQRRRRQQQPVGLDKRAGQPGGHALWGRWRWVHGSSAPEPTAGSQPTQLPCQQSSPCILQSAAGGAQPGRRHVVVVAGGFCSHHCCSAGAPCGGGHQGGAALLLSQAPMLLAAARLLRPLHAPWPSKQVPCPCPSSPSCALCRRASRPRLQASSACSQPAATRPPPTAPSSRVRWPVLRSPASLASRQSAHCTAPHLSAALPPPSHSAAMPLMACAAGIAAELLASHVRSELQGLKRTFDRPRVRQWAAARRPQQRGLLAGPGRHQRSEAPVAV